jgi:hypothetical protein
LIQRFLLFRVCQYLASQLERFRRAAAARGTLQESRRPRQPRKVGSQLSHSRVSTMTFLPGLGFARKRRNARCPGAFPHTLQVAFSPRHLARSTPNCPQAACSPGQDFTGINATVPASPGEIAKQVNAARSVMFRGGTVERHYRSAAGLQV